VGPAFGRNSSLRRLFRDPQTKHGIRDCRQRPEFYSLARFRPPLGVNSHQPMIRIHIPRDTLKPNQSVDLMGGSRSGRSAFVSHRRLPPVANVCRSATRLE